MFCPNCGRENADDAVYCQKCGRELDPEEETRVAGRAPSINVYAPPRRGPEALSPEGTSDEPAREIFTVSPTLLFVKIGYVAAVAAAFLMAALAAGISSAIDPTRAVLLGLGLCVVFLIVPAFYHLRQ